MDDRITITTSAGAETRRVVAIASDTSLTADSPFTGSANGVVMQVSPFLLRITDSSGAVRVFVPFSGNVGLGTLSPTETLTVAGDLRATGTVSFNGASNVLKIRRYADLAVPLSAANFPATNANEFGFVWDGSNFWLIYNDSLNKWKWQGIQVL